MANPAADLLRERIRTLELVWAEIDALRIAVAALDEKDVLLQRVIDSKDDKPALAILVDDIGKNIIK